MLKAAVRPRHEDREGKSRPERDLGYGLFVDLSRRYFTLLCDTTLLACNRGQSLFLSITIHFKIFCSNKFGLSSLLFVYGHTIDATADEAGNVLEIVREDDL